MVVFLRIHIIRVFVHHLHLPTLEFQAKVVIAAIKENETLVALSKQFYAHSNQI